MQQPSNEACFVISVAARLVGVHAQTLRYYERAGLLRPQRSQGRIRYYSLADLQRARLIKEYIEDLGVNLAGVEVILKLTDRIQELERENARLRRQLAVAEGQAR
jgi:MerR family transcriptional regulator/heat shock protein HspR